LQIGTDVLIKRIHLKFSYTVSFHYLNNSTDTRAEDLTGSHSSPNRKKRLQFARAHQNWTVED